MRLLVLTAAFLAATSSASIVQQRGPEVSPIEIPLCEEFCETWSRSPFLVVQTFKAQSEFEFCLVEGLSRFQTPPAVYRHKKETIVMVYQGGVAAYRIAITIVPTSDGYLVAGYTKRSGLAEKVSPIIEICTQD